MKLTSPFKLGWLPTRGDIAPDWYGVDTSGARVGKDLFAGHTVLFCFVPAAPDAALPMLKGLRARYARIVEKGAVLCCVLLEQPVGESFPYPTIIDPNQQVTNAFCRHRNEVKASPRAVLQDGDGRILATVPISLSAEGAEAALDLVIKHEPFTESLSLHAPVLHVPNVLGPKQCEQLIRAFREGEQRQGTTINIRDGKPVIVVNAKHKLRTDYTLRGDLKENMWSILVARIKPAIRRAFHFDIAHYEYMQIGRYGAEHKGFFRAHRDNFSTVSRHRRYAMSLNLNDGYEGGYLRFLEYGKRQYRPKSGDAVIFSTALLHEALPVTKGERFVLVSFFWGEAEVPLFEESKRIKAMGKTVVANRRIMSPAPARRPTPATDTDKHLRQDARLFREIAGDLKAFGPEAARVPNLVQRLSALNADLMHLHRDLHAVRARFVDNQTRKLKLGSELKVHLGCGRYRLKGWVNIDATGGDVRMDLRWPLPFADGSAKYVFASHVVEHFYRDTELPPLLKEVHRILAPGGVFRVIVPDIERCLHAYTSIDDAFFVERKKTWPWAASCQTHLDHFLTYAGANQRLERFGGHKYGFDFETLVLALREAGFKQSARSSFMNSSHNALRIDRVSTNAQANVDGNYYSLFVEATKGEQPGRTTVNADESDIGNLF